jgi:hypothetical protein
MGSELEHPSTVPLRGLARRWVPLLAVDVCRPRPLARDIAVFSQSSPRNICIPTATKLLKFILAFNQIQRTSQLDHLQSAEIPSEIMTFLYSGICLTPEVPSEVS